MGTQYKSTLRSVSGEMTHAMSILPFTHLLSLAATSFSEKKLTNQRAHTGNR